ncbi:MAG: hypothetical protein ACLFUO_03785 [Candidatus Woesearchaeota archaeon]
MVGKKKTARATGRNSSRSSSKNKGGKNTRSNETRSAKSSSKKASGDKSYKKRSAPKKRTGKNTKKTFDTMLKDLQRWDSGSKDILKTEFMADDNKDASVEKQGSSDVHNKMDDLLGDAPIPGSLGKSRSADVDMFEKRKNEVDYFDSIHDPDEGIPSPPADNNDSDKNKELLDGSDFNSRKELDKLNEDFYKNILSEDEKDIDSALEKEEDELEDDEKKIEELDSSYLSKISDIEKREHIELESPDASSSDIHAVSKEAPPKPPMLPHAVRSERKEAGSQSDVPPPPKKKGFFSRIFKKKQTEKQKSPLEMIDESFDKLDEESRNEERKIEPEMVSRMEADSLEAGFNDDSHKDDNSVKNVVIEAPPVPRTDSGLPKENTVDENKINKHAQDSFKEEQKKVTADNLYDQPSVNENASFDTSHVSSEKDYTESDDRFNISFDNSSADSKEVFSEKETDPVPARSLSREDDSLIRQKFMRIEKEKHALDKREEELKEMRDEFRSERERFMIEQKAFESKISEFEKLKKENKNARILDISVEKLKEKEKTLLESVRRLEREIKDKSSNFESRSEKLSSWEAALDKREHELDERENLLLTMQTDIIRERRELDDREFQIYMKEELAHIPTKLSGKDYEAEQARARFEQQLSPRSFHLRSMINQARHMLINGKIKDAKYNYNRIVKDFETSDLDTSEKKKLHLMILELYNDVHLAETNVK